MLEENSVDNGHRRHKCSICGRVRFEKKMQIIIRDNYNGGFYEIVTRFGNKCWVCVDNPDCRHKAKYFQVY